MWNRAIWMEIAGVVFCAAIAVVFAWLAYVAGEQVSWVWSEWVEMGRAGGPLWFFFSASLIPVVLMAIAAVNLSFGVRRDLRLQRRRRERARRDATQQVR